MKLYKSLWPLFFVVILPLWMAGCYQTPEFPVIPKIDFESVDFKRGDRGFDTLIMRVKFQDGDGDLGLSGDENDPPYNALSFYPNRTDPCRFSERFDARCSDVLPPDFSCVNYQYFETLGQDTINDTLYIKINENQYNFIVDLMTKENGQFEVFDFREELCVAPLSGRFPWLKDNFNAESPLEGVIEFRPPSSALQALFRNDTLKLRIRIKDRALNDSNIIESCEFTLNELLEIPDRECPPRP